MKVQFRRYAGSARRHAFALVNDFLNHNVMQMSAALTYYTVLSLFPALFIVVALLGFIGLSPDTLSQLLDGVADRTDSEWAVDLVGGVLTSILDSRATGIYLGAGVIVSLWSASGYVMAFMWASDRIYDPPARRSYWQGLPVRVGLALLLIVLFTTAAAMVTLLGPLGDTIARSLGFEDGALYTWSESASPLLFIAALVMLTLLYRFAPSRRQPRLWRLTAGACAALVLWYIASICFSFYLANFASYNKVYGTLGAAVAFLVWVWILNVGALIGVELNRALERRPAEDAGPRLIDEAGADAERLERADAGAPDDAVEHAGRL